MRIAAGALALLFGLTACGGAATPASSATVKVADDAKLGKILVSSGGLTLYTFSRDTANTSSCADDCAQNWPPVTLASGDPVAPAGLKGTLGTASRKDGTKQLTYNGKPLYRFGFDKNPGDTGGNGLTTFGGTWSAIRDP